MTRYKVVRKDVIISASHSDHDGHPSDATERLEAGEVYDESEIPDASLEGFPDRFEEVPEPEPDDTEDELPLDLSAMTNDEIEAALEDEDFSGDQLQALLDYEQSHDDRAGAKEHIQAAME